MAEQESYLRDRVEVLRRAVQDASHFDIDDAMLCLSCGEVFKNGPNRCPVCHQTTFLFVQSLIDLKEIQGEIQARCRERGMLK